MLAVPLTLSPMGKLNAPDIALLLRKSNHIRRSSNLVIDLWSVRQKVFACPAEQRREKIGCHAHYVPTAHAKNDEKRFCRAAVFAHMLPRLVQHTWNVDWTLHADK